ncbi:MAG: hypothetical protein PHI35_02840 [Victivallaceae bacterium]|nr:hypothetical protein [Victivallaceae bacterium]
MGWIDWLIVIIPMTFVIGVGIYSKKYARGVADFLVAGRIAGRYVLSVGDMAAALSVITLVAGVEQNYQTGYAVAFWGAITAPVGVFIALTGYCTYRWRETRCLSLGQFLELRYGSKFFRIFCATLRTVAEMVTNAIGPAIAANFFIYYLGLPHRIMICGINLPCYGIIVTLCLVLAMALIWPGGRISLLITDCLQGVLSYPIFVIIVGYILLNFSWFDDIAPVMWNRVPGQSFMSPYDISQLRDFNMFALVVSLLGSVLNRAGWIGNDTTGAAKSPHEQKMSGVLGSWRSGFSWMMIMLLAIITITFMNSPHFSGANRFKTSSTEVRQTLSQRVLEEAVPDEAVRNRIIASIRNIPSTLTEEKINAPLSQQQNMDTPYFETVRNELGDTPDGRYQFQQYRSLFQQMMMPTLAREIFPVGMIGLFCLLMIMLLVSTDDSRIFNASSTLMQDVVLPLFKGHLSPKRHLLLLRLMSLAVAGFFLLMSLLFAQLDYINMFTTIMCALWLGGAGPIMVFGLYSRFGNLVGAWCAIIFGSGTSLLGLIMQRNWTLSIYPFLERMELVEPLDRLLQSASGPFDPWIVWTMDPVKFPINSFEIYFISMVLSIGGYVLGSYLTYKPYNLEKLLHRGIYADGPEPQRERWTLRNIFSKIIGITPEYTKGDRIIAYSVFIYSVVYGVGICFFAIVLWNFIDPWPDNWWTIKFYITSLLIPAITGSITTVWFMWGGLRDIRQLFIDLEHRIEDPTDNGQVFDSQTGIVGIDETRP